MTVLKKNPVIITLLFIVLIIAITIPTLNARNKDSQYNENLRVDTKRVRDITELNNILRVALITEEISLINTSKCSDCNSQNGSRSVNGDGWIKFKITEGKSGISNQKTELPLDPNNSGLYMYSYYSDGLDYEINAYLGSQGESALNMESDGGNDPNMYEVGTNLELK